MRARRGLAGGVLAVVVAGAVPAHTLAQPATPAAERDRATGDRSERDHALRLLVEQAAADARHDRLVGASAVALAGVVSAATGLWLARHDAGNELRGSQAGVLVASGVFAVESVIELLGRSPGERLRDAVVAERSADDRQALLLAAAAEERARRVGPDRRSGLTFVGLGAIAAIWLEGDDRFAGHRGAARLSAASLVAFGVWSLGRSYTTGPVENAARIWSGQRGAPPSLALSVSPVDGGAAVGLGGRF